MNNYRAEQGGEATFRYVVTGGATLAPESLARFGRAAMTPLETDQVIDQDKVGNPDRPLAPAPRSFLHVDVPNVVVEAWKAADDGNGTVLRLLETGGKESATMLRFPMPQLQRAWLCNAMEEDSKELAVENSSVEVALQPHQIVTVRMLGEFQRPGP